MKKKKLFLTLIIYLSKTMRMWSISPIYIGGFPFFVGKKESDYHALVALWKESIQAINVIKNKAGYFNHSGLTRFKKTGQPLNALAEYLRPIYKHATENCHYNFNKELIPDLYYKEKIPVTKGQIEYEFDFYLGKLYNRKKKSLLKKLANIDINDIKIHPLFYLIEGQIENWERIK